MDFNLPGSERVTALDMATNTIKECPVCEEDFNETDRSPHTLPCSHYLCANCINRMIRDKRKMCPFCCCAFQANSSRDIMVNRAVIDYLHYQPTNKLVSRGQGRLSKRLAQKELDAADVRECLQLACEDAAKEVENVRRSIRALLKDLEGESGKVEREILPTITRIKTLNEQKKRELQSMSGKMGHRLGEIKEKQTKLREIQEKIDGANSFKEAAVLMDEAEILNDAVGEWTVYYKTLMSEDNGKFQCIEKDINDTKAKTKMILLQYSGDPSHLKQPINLHQEPVAHELVALQQLQSLDEPMKSLVEGRLVFAADHQHGTRFARILIQDHKLCLQDLREAQLPENASVLDHPLVLNLVSPSVRIAFLDLFEDCMLFIGSLYIFLSPDSDGAKQFAMLCTGERGPSYVGSTALVVAHKGCPGEHVRFGDYEHNTGQGGEALIPGLHYGNIYERPDIDGIVAGNGWATQNESISAQFNIRTRGRPGKNCQSAFGQVVENFHILTDIIQRQRNIKDVDIGNCGLVLHCTASL